MDSSLDRRIGRLLDSYPRLRAMSKFAYQRAAFFVYGGKSGPLTIHSHARISDASDFVSKSPVEKPNTMFFGYFGTSPWSPCGRYFLVHSLRDGNPAVSEVHAIDLHSGTTTVLGQTRAWNYQQGSMAQWVGNATSTTVAFNDLVGGSLGCRLVSLEGGERFLPWPVQAIHPAGTEALSLNYRRLWHMRPEYGYRVSADNFAPDQPTGSDGLWRFSLESGESRLLFSLDDLMQNRPRPEMAGAGHKVNHAVYSPGGQQVVFLHRWLGSKGKFSRLYHATSDGRDLRLLLDERMVSHYTWRDEKTLLVFARARPGGDRYYLIDMEDGEIRSLGSDALDGFGDGHPSYSPDRQWIVTDTYPDRGRMRRLLLLHCADLRLLEVGAFFTPWRFDGAVRCDLHPRWSPDGQAISVDSVHEGSRRCYVLDVSRIVNS